MFTTDFKSDKKRIWIKHYYYIVITEFNFRRIIMDNAYYAICFILKKGGDRTRKKRRSKDTAKFPPPQ